MMHFEIYKRRGDVGGQFSTGMIGKSPPMPRFLGVPETKTMELSGTTELLLQVLDVLGGENFLVMKDHGFLSLGRTMDEAGNLALRIKREIGGKLRRSQ